LTHPNTIEIFDYGHAEDDTFYYVMEYLRGMNLEKLVEQHGPLPPERAVHLHRQVCQALREAHRIGLIHRDIKPSNIFACERGQIYHVAKQLDFGLVKTSGMGGDSVKLTAEGVFAGSPAFMSPEQALGREQFDARSDIYNVGAVGYFVLTGQLPFDRHRLCNCFTRMLLNRSFRSRSSTKPYPPIFNRSFGAVWQKFQRAVIRTRGLWKKPWLPVKARINGLPKEPRSSGSNMETGSRCLFRWKEANESSKFYGQILGHRHQTASSKLQKGNSKTAHSPPPRWSA
jgi:serine/threonine protein kinase